MPTILFYQLQRRIGFPLLKRNIFSLIVWMLATGIPAIAHAELMVALSANVTSEDNGLYKYEYTLSNLTTSDIPAIMLNLEVTPGTHVQPISSPDGWSEATFTNAGTLSWAPLDHPYAIAPGSNGTFVFLSNHSPGKGRFSVNGFDANTFTFGFSNGETTAPNIVSRPKAAKNQPLRTR